MAHLKFPIKKNEDPEITCIVCGKKGCELELQIFSKDRTMWSGLHGSCWKYHAERVRWHMEDEEIQEPELGPRPIVEQVQDFYQPPNPWADLLYGPNIQFGPSDVGFVVSGLNLEDLFNFNLDPNLTGEDNNGTE